MSRPLVPVIADDPARILAALRDALQGGPALLPVDPALVAAVPATALVADDIAVVIHTSGSTDAPKEVALTAAALVAAAKSSADRIGSGHWLLALPGHYIAGIQVLVRSLVAGTEPTLLPAGHVSPAVFAEAANAMPAGPRYTSLVPTQLAAILDDAAAATVLAGFSAVLVGGQALPGALREKAAAAGVTVVTTYGSSETSGGCVYDGEPLPGTAVRVVDGLLELSAPGLADGYLEPRGDAEVRGLDRARTAAAFPDSDGRRWYRSQDRGTVAPDGTVTVLGRADDVIITGGIKVPLDEVQWIVRDMPGAQSALVLPVDSSRWGQASVVVVLDADGGGADLLPRIRERVRAVAGSPARPVAVVSVERFPLLSSGKPDRRRLIALAQQAADTADS